MLCCVLCLVWFCSLVFFFYCFAERSGNVFDLRARMLGEQGSYTLKKRALVTLLCSSLVSSDDCVFLFTVTVISTT